jgi:fructan beta-fructosidase
MKRFILFSRFENAVKNSFLLYSLAVIFFTVRLFSQSQSQPMVIENFDGSSYGNWKVEGNAFGEIPAGGKGRHRMPGFLGKGFASSVSSVDTAVGTLTSPPFVIKRKCIHFLIGADEIFFLPGSQQYGNLAVQLLIDDEVVRMTVPGRFHSMFWESWDVSEFLGASAQIKIIDNDKRNGAHIDVDQIVQSDIPPGGALLSRRIIITETLLNFPVEEKGVRQFIELLVDGKPVRSMDVALATDTIDYWAFTEVSSWLGKEMTIRTFQFFGNPNILDKISAEEGLLDANDLYHEPLRSQFHFSSKRGWLNDPNGLVFYDGEYHLFYQHNPYGCDFSRNDYNKSWGHAVSTDLVHWTELPEAVYPDSLGSIYSGSAVVDEFNTAGFQTGKEKPIVAMFTSAGNRNPWSEGKPEGKPFTQSLAYSNDRGRTFTKYQGNPVLENMEYVNRDPKVFWYEPEKKWVLVLHFDERAMAFFNSKDLKTWEFKSELEIKRLVDCPELFSLPVDGDKTNRKWILYGGSGYYYVGNFDGKEYKPETGEIKYSYGNCFYASQTFNNMPQKDGRRIQIAWGRIPTPGMPFNQIMLFPVELTLRSTDDGLRLFAYPVEEIKNIYSKKYEWKNVQPRLGENILSKIEGELFDIQAEFVPAETGEFGFVVNGIPVVYNIDHHQLTCGGSEANLEPVNGKIQLRMLIDRISIEIFANDGKIYMPVRASAADNRKGLALFTTGGSTTIGSLKVYQLKSIWK